MTFSRCAQSQSWTKINPRTAACFQQVFFTGTGWNVKEVNEIGAGHWDSGEVWLQTQRGSALSLPVCGGDGQVRMVSVYPHCARKVWSERKPTHSMRLPPQYSTAISTWVWKPHFDSLKYIIYCRQIVYALHLTKQSFTKKVLRLCEQSKR